MGDLNILEGDEAAREAFVACEDAELSTSSRTCWPVDYAQKEGFLSYGFNDGGCDISALCTCFHLSYPMRQADSGPDVGQIEYCITVQPEIRVVLAARPSELWGCAMLLR